MKVLLICDAESIHVFNYIQYVLLPMKCQVSVLTPRQPIAFIDYYNSKKIDFKIAKPISGTFLKIPGIRGIMQAISISKDIKRMGQYDFCHVHMYSYPDVLGAYIARKRAGRLIVSFWGSDLFTRKKPAALDKIIMGKVNEITLSTPAMEDKFHELFGMHHDHRIVSVKFGLPALELIKTLEENEDNEKAKKKLSLPKDKIIVTCGYNGNPEQQHVEILEAIGKCSDDIKDKIYLVLPMGYGKQNKQYIEKISSIMKSLGLNGYILDRFLGNEDNALLRMVTDIFINVQKTDAFSASMQEHLFAGSVVINGGWLDYRDLDKAHAKYIRLETFGDLTYKLTDAIKEYNTYKKDTRYNRDVIWKLSSWEAVCTKWQSLYR